ncbi:MAG TPA: flippase [Candidatus Limnocylindria bacterium]|nr:flippase [Candidatus Limnocylindria bacterium]
MTLFRTAARNISVLGASQVVMWLAGIAFTIAQATHLGPARFGEFAVALSYAGLLTVLIDFGLAAQLTRLVAQRASRHEDALGLTMLINGALWLLAIPLVVVATLALGYSRELRETILVLAISVLFIGVANTVAAYLQGRERFFIPALATVAQRLTAAGLGIFMLLVRPELTAVAGAFVVSGVVNIAVLAVALRGRATVTLRVDPRSAGDLFRRTVPLGLFGIAAMVFWSLDMILMQRLAPAENVGWYAAAYRLFGVATILPSVAVGIALAPVLSRLSVDSRSELRAVIEKLSTFMIVAGAAGAIVLVLFADRIIALLYPADAYTESAMALRLLAPGLLFAYVNRVYAQSLVSLHQERRLLVMAAAAAVLNGTANFVLIPQFQQNGAALVTSLTELFWLAAVVLLTPRDLLSSESVRVATRTLLAASATAILLLPAQGLGLALGIPLTLAVFAGLAVTLRAVSTTDLLALRSLVRPTRAEAQVLSETPLTPGAAR